MFKIKSVTAKNFLSVGNSTQSVKFDTQDLTLVLGENIDLGGDDSGSRNGVGKTAILNALSYALYGQALTNIRKENLINKTNGKGLLVTVDFEVNGKHYRVERGRKPNIFKFFIDSEELAANDEAQGDSRETQHAIDNLLGMTHDMFRHLVALNTYTEPFLSLKANDQRMIIEQLLGITLLSEKADRLREQMRITRDLASQEEHRIRAATSANSRIQEQILSCQRRQRMWQEKHHEDAAQMQLVIDQLNQIDIEQEIGLHTQWCDFRAYQQTHNQISQILAQKVSVLQKEIRSFDRLERELLSLQNNQCYTCGQPVKNLAQVTADKTAAIAESQQTVQQLESEIHQLDLELVQLNAVSEPSETFYPDRETATEHRINLQALQTQLMSKQSETDPYQEQITEMSTQALEEICYDTMNTLKRVQEHQEFLLKLLTNKDSFVRKKIIDQNLSYLNQRLSYYLYKMGLPHRVTFQSDLSVQIEELGRELDFDNLSRGERNRLILSLSWSFRDVWESLYHPVNLMFIDEMIDNGMDSSGVENAMSILKHMARDRQRSVWLISHKDELASRVNNVLKVVKENGFTQYLQEKV